MIKRVVIFLIGKTLEAVALLLVLVMLFGASCARADAWTLGVHAVSVHNQSGYETLTPGLYARAPSGLTFGAYRNSHARVSAYVGHTWERNGFALTLGAVTGYERAKVLPMIVPSYLTDRGLRVSLLVNPWGASAIHLSYER